MYYEIHGSGRPLVLLHGGFMTIDGMEVLAPALAETRQVIGIEQQGHGHTADIDRPLTYEQMADDTAALLRYLGIERADIYGYSMGGGTALQLAIRHPDLVRKLVIVSASFRADGMYPEARAAIAAITPELFAGSPMEAAYQQTSPNPDAFPALVSKLKRLDVEDYAWPVEELRAITAPALVILGDADGISPEHAIELFRLFGGGVMGDLAGMPASQLAILPGTNHIGILERSNWIVAMTAPFLDAPLPEAQ
jgi:pimeloyl-ACP methyl ester carboxylesterase